VTATADGARDGLDQPGGFLEAARHQEDRDADRATDQVSLPLANSTSPMSTCRVPVAIVRAAAVMNTVASP
jgi:hypothetical protein